MSTENSARARTVGPSHGVGRITPFTPGESGNPGGRPTRFREVREICRNKSAAAALALIRIVEDVDQNDRNVEDGRVVVVAAQTILTWAYGKPPDYDPREDKPPVTIDTSHLSSEDRAPMLRILRFGVLRYTEGEPAADPPTEIAGEAEESSALVIPDRVELPWRQRSAR